MNILFTVLFAFAIGFFVKQRGLAVVTYLALAALLFAYQTLSVLLEWLGPKTGMEGEAFGPKPTGLPLKFSNRDLARYGLINLIAITVGVGLVVLGTRVARRRLARRTSVEVA